MSCPVVCSPLLVVENAKRKLRLVIDLHYVNQFLIQCKCKYEGLDIISSLFRKGDFVFPFTSSLATTMCTFRRIHSLTLVFPGVRVIGRNFIFSVYSLLACYVFTKLPRL